MDATDSGALLERADDLAAIDRLLVATTSGAASFGLVEGPPGIGKTALLQAARQRADARGIRVMRACASELEVEFAYGVVRQLLEPVVARLSMTARAALFTGAARPAARVLGAEPGAVGGGSFGTLHGLYWVVVGLASETPLVLCVDDLQWADRPSLRFLVHLARRLESTRAGMLLGARTAEPAAGDDLLDRLRSSEGARVIRPTPLSVSAVVDVVRGELGPGADQSFCL